MEQKIITAGTFVQIHRRSNFALGAASEIFESTYQKKGEKSAGVISMMDTIIKDLATDSKDAEFAEKTAQTEFAELMDDSQATKMADIKALTTKGSAKATAEESLMTSKQTFADASTDLKLINTAIAETHTSCDFILQNYDLRSEARTSEIEGLKNAKAVLLGASYSF